MKTADISVQRIDHSGSDLSVVNAARVSFDKESHYEEGPSGLSWDLPEKDVRLIRYLALHKHTSPFNHAFASFRVKAPVFVARQLVKHKFLPWNEVSRRYVNSEPEFFFPEYWRQSAENVKQGSSDNPHKDSEVFGAAAAGYIRQILRVYTDMIENGICAEQARMVLPQNMMTEWIWSGTLGAWADMCKLRLDPHAQYETRIVAQKISNEMSSMFPHSWKSLLES